MIKIALKNTALLSCAAALAALAGTSPALADGPGIVDFNTLSHPATGVGAATRVYQEYGPGTLTLIRIPDASGNNPASYGNHFHTVAGVGAPSGTAGFQTAAEFFSDDGAPFYGFLGNYTGTSTANYAPDFSTAKAFSLTSFNVLSLSGTYQLTAAAADPASIYTFGTPATGNTITIDHTGIYTLANTPGLAGFQNIMGYRQDYTAATDGFLVLDDITYAPVSTSAAPVPEASSAVSLGLCLLVGGGLSLAARRRRQAA